MDREEFSESFDHTPRDYDQDWNFARSSNPKSWWERLLEWLGMR